MISIIVCLYHFLNIIGSQINILPKNYSARQHLNFLITIQGNHYTHGSCYSDQTAPSSESTTEHRCCKWRQLLVSHYTLSTWVGNVIHIIHWNAHCWGASFKFNLTSPAPFFCFSFLIFTNTWVSVSVTWSVIFVNYSAITTGPYWARRDMYCTVFVISNINWYHFCWYKTSAYHLCRIRISILTVRHFQIVPCSDQSTSLYIHICGQRWTNKECQMCK